MIVICSLFLIQGSVLAYNSGYNPYYDQVPALDYQEGLSHPSVNPMIGNGGIGQFGNPGTSFQGVQGDMRFQNQNLRPSAPDRFIVKYKDSMQPNTPRQVPSPDQVMNSMGGTPPDIHQQPLGNTGLQLVQVSSSSLDTTMSVFQNSPLVEYTEPDYMITVEPSATGIQMFTPSYLPTTIKPNDPEYSHLWGLHNTGQSPFNGTSGADISAEEAWGISTGSRDIVVAVIDSGVDITHPDLAENIWTNEKEIAGNGIDDDGNGFVDDIHGWNFQGQNNSPVDENGHGTHCAGIIGAVGDNNIGVTGVNWHVRIMPLRFMDSTGNGYISDAVSAILYANKMGADVISCSWSGTEFSQALKDAIAASPAVVVCAAGNGGDNDDTTSLYPATFTGSNQITVAATDSNDNLASFSNYGVSSVNIAAPGVEIASTYPGNKYAYMSGTSMATPYVAGVAALLKSEKPSLTTSQIRDKVLSSADPIGNLSGKISTGGRLDAYRVLIGESSNTGTTVKVINPSLPTSISTQVPTSTTSGTIILTQPSLSSGRAGLPLSGVSPPPDSYRVYPYS